LLVLLALPPLLVLLLQTQEPLLMSTVMAAWGEAGGVEQQPSGFKVMGVALAA
jgi:hypothetical protein